MVIIKKTKENKCWCGWEKRKLLCTVGVNVNWYNHYGKLYGGSSENYKIELLYDPAIPLLGIYPKEMKSLSWKDICISISTAAISTIAKK